MPHIDSTKIYQGRVGYWATLAGGSTEYFDVAAVELCAAGHSGWGETIIDDGHHTPIETLVAMAEAVVGRELAGPTSILPELSEDRPYGAVRCCREALSIALYDLIGHVYGIPVATLLGGVRRTRVPGMPTITIEPPEVMARQSCKWQEAGYRYLKIKFGGDMETDLAVIECIRTAVGPDMELHVDANSAYHGGVEAVVEVVKKMAPWNIAVVEDMYCGTNAQYHEIRSRIQPKHMVDWHAYWPNVLKMIHDDTADVINLHSRNQGGLDIAMRTHAAAHAAGVETRIGAEHILGIGNAAFQILGAVMGGSMPCEEIGPLRYQYHFGAASDDYPEDEDRLVVSDPFGVEDGDIIVRTDRPGLGVQVDRARLEKITSNVIELA